MTALRLLLFRCGGQVLAVEAGVVREIIAASEPTRIPGAPSAVVGLGGTTRRATLVIVERHGRPVGLAVEEVLDLVTVPAASLDDRASLPGVRPDLVRAAGSAGGHAFVQLATDAVLEPLLP